VDRLIEVANDDEVRAQLASLNATLGDIDKNLLIRRQLKRTYDAYAASDATVA